MSDVIHDVLLPKIAGVDGAIFSLVIFEYFCFNVFGCQTEQPEKNKLQILQKSSKRIHILIRVYDFRCVML